MVFKWKQLNTFFLHCQNLHDDLCLIDPSIINFGEESLLNALLYGSDSVFWNKFSRFNIPYILQSKAQSHTITYICCNPEVFYKKVFLKFLRNSQENSCPGVYFSCICNRKRLWQFVCCEFSETGLMSKHRRQMLANVS